MEAKWRKTFELHAKTDEFKRRVDWSRRYIRRALAECRKMFISFSGGKDSICMAHLVLQQDSNVLLYHHDQGNHMPNEIRIEILEIMNRMARYIEIRNFEESLWTVILPEFQQLGFDGSFVGLRKEESVSRRERINADRSLSGIKEYWPIQNWTWLDVWAYIIINNLPYPSSYDVYGPVMGWNRVRFHSFFDKRLERFGNENLDGVLMWKFRHRGKG